MLNCLTRVSRLRAPSRGRKGHGRSSVACKRGARENEYKKSYTELRCVRSELYQGGTEGENLTKRSLEASAKKRR